MLLDSSSSLSRLLRMYLVSATLVTTPAYAISVDFEDFDKRDVDILVGDFSSLVKAFQKFATNENSILEQRIDQVFDRFDHSMTCAIDQTMAKAHNTLGRSIPDFKIFRSDEAEHCQNTEVLRPNVGVLDRARLEQCIVRRLLLRKTIPFEGVSAAYSGLKEFANAAYCGARGREGTAEYELSKNYFSHASIMAEVYDDISELKGCKQSSPKYLFDCTDQYYAHMTKALRNLFPLDQDHVDYENLAALREALSPPEIKKRWVFFEEAVLTLDQLNSYEALSAELRRNYDLAKLNKARRQQEYRKMVVDTISEIKKHKKTLTGDYTDLKAKYSSCNFVEANYVSSFPTSVFEPLSSSAQICTGAIQSNAYSDFVTVKQKQQCLHEAPGLISKAADYVEKMKSDCDKSIDDHGKKVEERNFRMGAY